MRNHLPYRMHETGMEGQWLLVNRQYKPVGSNRPNAWADHAAIKALHFTLDAEVAAGVSHPDHVRSQGLYGDGSTPWSSRADAKGYLERLKRLLAALDRPFAAEAWTRAKPDLFHMVN